MKLPPKFQLTDKKYKEILAMIDDLGVDLDQVEEVFVKGSGKGGQKINKTNSAVQLRHLPTGTIVKYQKFRERGMNRILGLRHLLNSLSESCKKSSLNEKKEQEEY
jgi:protein subunit release factor B